MKKIIHLTDLHIGKGQQCGIDKEDACHNVFGNIVKNIIDTMKPASDYIIVITGDLVDNANIKDNITKAKAAIDKLKEKFAHVLIIPGNHDYGRGLKVKKKNVIKFKKNFLGDPNIEYPKYDKIDNMAFIGLDSMAEAFRKRNGWFADGKLGNDQLHGNSKKNIIGLVEYLEKATKEAEHIVVYLHHHPFKQLDYVHGHPFHGLKDHDKLTKILKKHNNTHDNIKLLLFGHNHDGEERWNARLGIPRCYDGGTSTGHEKDPMSPHRIFDLSDGTDGYSVGNFYRP